jgi:hypothetical protein
MIIAERLLFNAQCLVKDDPRAVELSLVVEDSGQIVQRRRYGRMLFS